LMLSYCAFRSTKGIIFLECGDLSPLPVQLRLAVQSSAFRLSLASQKHKLKLEL
jgi:hypothetical protein